MIYLGIDPGSHNLGYAFLEERRGKMFVLEYGVIRAKPKDSLFERLQDINQELKVRILDYNPDILGLEGIFFSKNPKSALILGQARGSILACFFGSSTKIIEFSPKEIKQAVALKGNASKQQVALMVQQRLNLQEIPKSLDASDALAIAYTAYLRNNS